MSKERATLATGMATSFGFREVDRNDKQSLVNQVFHRVAGRYDLMNDLMSGGLHRLWKDALVGWLNPPRRAGWTVLDVAGGTGDLAIRIVEATDRQAHATVLDINESMLDVGRRRLDKLGLAEHVDFVEGNAEALPFAADSFDAFTIGFGLRNVPRIDEALTEAYRVLKPGGRFLCLEFSEVDMPLLDRAYAAWSFSAIPRLGKLVAGDDQAYAYLVESIRKFPNQENLAGLMRQAGFARVSYRNYCGGIAALHSGWKV